MCKKLILLIIEALIVVKNQDLKVMMAKYNKSGAVDPSKLPQFQKHMDQLKDYAEEKARETDINKVINNNDPTAKPIETTKILESKLIPAEIKDTLKDQQPMIQQLKKDLNLPEMKFTEPIQLKKTLEEKQSVLKRGSSKKQAESVDLKVLIKDIIVALIQSKAAKSFAQTGGMLTQNLQNGQLKNLDISAVLEKFNHKSGITVGGQQQIKAATAIDVQKNNQNQIQESPYKQVLNQITKVRGNFGILENQTDQIILGQQNEYKEKSIEIRGDEKLSGYLHLISSTKKNQFQSQGGQNFENCEIFQRISPINQSIYELKECTFVHFHANGVNEICYVFSCTNKNEIQNYFRKCIQAIPLNQEQLNLNNESEDQRSFEISKDPYSFMDGTAFDIKEPLKCDQGKKIANDPSLILIK